MFTRHGLPRIQASAIELPSLLLGRALRVKRGDGGDDAGFPVFTLALNSFPESWSASSLAAAEVPSEVVGVPCYARLVATAFPSGL